MLNLLAVLSSASLPHDPRLWPNQPGFWPSLGVFVVYAWMLLAIIGDCYYTGIGLSKGFVEKSVLSRWLFKKIGQALTCFLKAGAVTLIPPIFIHNTLQLGVFWGIIAVGETYMVYRNRKLLGMKF